MRVAVLGVGLIGGSIGLAARRRLKAEVVGFDPDPAILARALERGAVDAAAESVEAACAGAEVVFCAAPVRALPALVREALAASGAETVVSDVGSTKRELVASLADGARFIGGHPLAGAETSGVENAREDLFDGARWYLTPTPDTDDALYERLQRVVLELGARPQAIDPETHDRVMATVSHLPHVVANALAANAVEALAEEGEGLPEAGPSLRDSTRVAGANPAIWGDIYTTNREALAREIERLVERLRESAELLRTGDPGALSAWQHGARESRRRLLESDLAGGPVHELRVGVPNVPGVVAELALALGKAGVNIEDMTLHPAAEDQAGAISVWVAGDEASERAAMVLRGLGHTVSEAGEA